MPLGSSSAAPVMMPGPRRLVRVLRDTGTENAGRLSQVPPPSYVGLSHMALSVVSTEGRRPERRDLASTTRRLFVERRSLDFAPLRSGRRGGERATGTSTAAFPLRPSGHLPRLTRAIAYGFPVVSTKAPSNALGAGSEPR